MKLRKLSCVHLKLANTIKIINRTFSIALMLYFFVFFCWFCILLFIATRTTTTMLEKFHGFVLPRFILNMTLDGLMLSSLKSANDAAKEGKRSREVLFRMRSDCWNENLCKEVKKVREISGYFMKNFLAFLDRKLHRAGSVHANALHMRPVFVQLEICLQCE
jgi:hypothetical protein